MIYIYSNIPGASTPRWSLGVDAISRRDAAQYIRYIHRGAKFVAALDPSEKLPCDCLATTTARQEQIHEHFERWLNETD